jgi:resolvase-like protein
MNGGSVRMKSTELSGKAGGADRHDDVRRRMIFGVFAAFAEFERGLICERTVAVLAAARARGRKGGRRFALTKVQVRLAPRRPWLSAIPQSRRYARNSEFSALRFDRRWCTCRTEHAMTPTPICYAMTHMRRTESGRPAASSWFRTTTPMAASVCCAAKPRARNRGPISALYRPIVVSTRERLP